MKAEFEEIDRKALQDKALLTERHRKNEIDLYQYESGIEGIEHDAEFQKKVLEAKAEVNEYIETRFEALRKELNLPA